MPRPYLNLNTEQLESLVEEHEKERETLLAELKERSVPKARALLRRLDPAEAPKPNLDHYVYVIELDPDVLGIKEFRDRNPNHNPEYSCLYVGMTGKGPEERFAQHKRAYKASRKVKRFGLHLRSEFYERLNPMTKEDAEREEKELACALQKAGYAVWWN